MPAIRFLITGGTIDKIYDEINGSLTFDKTHMPAMLDQSRCHVEITPDIVLMKDSLEMDDSDREQIYQRCIACDESRIIISHGTDTMVDTAEVLSKIEGKTIVLFGAMIPFSITYSDSLFNLGCAITAAQCLDAGVYITMNGKVFPADNVKKNTMEGVFQKKK